MADFNAIVQIIPVNSKATWLYVPVTSLLRRGLRQPVQPLHLIHRDTQHTAIA